MNDIAPGATPTAAGVRLFVGRDACLTGPGSGLERTLQRESEPLGAGVRVDAAGTPWLRWPPRTSPAAVESSA